MLRHRFKYDGVPSEPMSRVQFDAKAAVEKKIIDGVYKFEKKPCPFCQGNELELLAEKDRYGLYAPTCVCRNCGLVHMNPRMTQESYNEFYDREYRKLYGSDNVSREDFFAQQQAQGENIYNVLRQSGSLKAMPESSLIIEVGCGAGGILNAFKRRGFMVKGIDLGEEYLEYGRTAHGLDLVSGSLDSVKLSQAPDVVIYNHVLEHVLDPLKELLKVRQVLADDGVVFIGVPGIKAIERNQRYHGDFMAYLQNAHVCHFSAQTLANILYLCGFVPMYIDESAFTIARKGQIDMAKAGNDYEPVMEYLRQLEKAHYQRERDQAAGKTTA